MTERIYFVYEGQRHEIRLDTEAAPETIRQLLANVPARIDLHCAKIAGRHIFWHAPFMARLEGGRDVLTAAPGTFLYWPERQFLELIYGELQAESAQVTVLGQLTGDIQWLIDLGDQLRREQGRRIIWASLELDAAAQSESSLAGPTSATGTTSPLPAGLAADPRFQALQATRAAAWTAQPEGVTELVSRRGILLPFGPLAMAEGEFRKLQELLWRYASQHGDTLAADARVGGAAFLVDAFITRIVDLCGMESCHTPLADAAQLLREFPEAHAQILQELVLYCGRMAAWLDLHIPWNDLNEAVVDSKGDVA
jgi:hypothetical protein